MARKITDKQIALTLTNLASIEARGAVVHFHHAHIRRAGDVYVMEGRTGKHTLHRDVTDLERLNAHWIGFVRGGNLYDA